MIYQLILISVSVVITYQLIIWEPLIKSIDSSPSVISDELKTLIHALAPQVQQKLPVIQHLTLQPIEGDKNRFISLNYIFNNGDIGTHDLKFLLAMSKEQGGNSLLTKSLFLSQSINENVVLSNPLEFPFIFQPDNPLIQCNYNITNVSYDIKTMNNGFGKTMSKTIGYNQFTFGLISNNIELMYYDGTNIVVENINRYEVGSNHLQGASIKDFFIIDQISIAGKYLVVHVEANNALIMFNIKVNMSLQLEYNNTIQLNRNGIVNKLGLYDDNVVVAIKDIGLFMISVNDNTIIIPICIKEEEKNSSDFIIANHFLFSLVIGKGIYIYNLKKSSSLPKLIQHSKINQIEEYLHPFYGIHYLGVGFEQKNINAEFFMEFIINNDPTIKTKLIPNKVLTSNTLYSFLPFYSYDKFNTFFYSKRTKTLFIVRKALSSQIDFVVYKIPLNAYDKFTHMMALHNRNTSMTDLALVSDSSILIVDKLTYSNNTLSCLFKESGSYLLRFVQRSDVCSASIATKFNFNNNYCQKSVNVNFNIYKEPDQLAAKLTFSFVIIVFGIIFAVLIGAIVKYTQCFMNNTLKLIDIDTRDKQPLYIESESEVFNTRNDEDNLVKTNSNKNKNNHLYNINDNSLHSSERGVMDNFKNSIISSVFDISGISRNTRKTNSQNSNNPLSSNSNTGSIDKETVMTKKKRTND